MFCVNKFRFLRKFIWYFVLIIAVNFNCLLKINGQGNHGVVINNRKIDKTSDIKHLQTKWQTMSPISIITTQSQNRSKTAQTSKMSFNTIKPLAIDISTPNFNQRKQMFVPQIINNFSGIDQILKQNRSDDEKFNEIYDKLNKTGALTRVNVFNDSTESSMKMQPKSTSVPTSTTMHPRNVTYVHTYENKNDHQKDSKELKVQFVLDCDLKDSMNSDMNVRQPDQSHSQTTKYISPIPVINKQPLKYPQFDGIFNQRIPTKLPNRQYYYQTTPFSYAQSKKPSKKFVIRPTKPTTSKEKIKKVYVDPPAVAAISNAFENVYNYFEDALTTNVVQKVPREKKRAVKRKMVRVNGQGRIPIRKRSTVNDRIAATTSTIPEYRYTKSHTNEANQKLTTQIHVTSEYLGKEPEKFKKPDESEEISESEGYDSADESDGDEDYDREPEYDDDDYGAYDFSIGGFGGSEEDEEEEDEESVEYDEPVPNKINVYKSNKKGMKKKKRLHKSNNYSSSDEDDGFSMSNMGKYFQQTYDSISRYVPTFTSVFGFDDDGEENENDNENKYEKRKPKIKKSPLFSRIPNQIEIEEKHNKWYDKFFFGSDEDEQPVTSIPVTTSTTTPSSFFHWFADSAASESTEMVVTETEKPPQSTQSSNWFSHLFFSGETTTKATDINEVTTKKPFISNEKKHEWLAMLATHMQAMTTPTTHHMNHTNTLKRVNYRDYQLWRILPATNAQLEFLREYKESDENEKVMWLKGPAMRGPNDILIPPDMNKEVQETLEYESIPYEVVVWDLEKAIKYENPVMSRRQKIELEKEQGHPMTWFRYHNFEDIAIYLDYLQLTYPNLVELIHIGRSFEGRPLIVAKISFESPDGIPRRNIKPKPSLKTRRRKKSLKPGIFIEAGVHGREWITPAVATWILKELVKFNDTEDGNTEKEIIRSVDWYIMPMMNPDGYEFSLNYDRLWKKTRSKLPETSSSMLKYALKWLRPNQKMNARICYGTDPDRNYDINWQTLGSSQSACSEIYAGPKALSEPETKALAAFLNENKKFISIFLSLHSYGQFITYPSTVNSTYGATQRSNDLRDMAEVAVNALRDFASSGRYSIDSTNEMLSDASGTSTDYAMHIAGIKYSYTIELRDTGTQGFLLSPSYIDSTGLETYEMIKAMIDFL